MPLMRRNWNRELRLHLAYKMNREYERRNRDEHAKHLSEKMHPRPGGPPMAVGATACIFGKDAMA